MVDTNLRANTDPVGKRCRGDPVGRRRGGAASCGRFRHKLRRNIAGRCRGGSRTARGSVPVQRRRLYTGARRGQGTAVPRQTPHAAWPTKTAAPRERPAPTRVSFVVTRRSECAMTPAHELRSSSGDRREELEHDAVERLWILRVGNVTRVRNHLQTRPSYAAHHVLR
jgi:hypothetical protein